MKLDYSGDSITIDVTDADADAAEHLSNTIHHASRLAETIGVGIQACEWCEDRNGPTRGYQLVVDGDFRVLDLCRDCQEMHVNTAVEKHGADSDGLVTDNDTVDASDDPDCPRDGCGEQTVYVEVEDAVYCPVHGDVTDDV